jgi:hypothetical protein
MKSQSPDSEFHQRISWIFSSGGILSWEHDPRFSIVFTYPNGRLSEVQ